MPSEVFHRERFVRNFVMSLCLVAIVVLGNVLPINAKNFPLGEADKIETTIYGDDFLKPVAVLKIEKIFTDQQRMGFFRVKLLPVLVVQGVRLELSEPSPNTNWLASLRFKPPTPTQNNRVEWRELSVSLPGENEPRLRAKRLFPSGNERSDFLRLENVTVQTDAGPLTVPRARLLLAGKAGRVTWETDGAIVQWDLFTRKLNSD